MQKYVNGKSQVNKKKKKERKKETQNTPAREKTKYFSSSVEIKGGILKIYKN